MSAKSYLIGFSTAVMWSPYFASVTLVLYYLEMPVGKYILYGLGISFLSLLVGNVLFAVWEKKYPLNRNADPEIPLKKHSRNQLFILAFFIFLLLATSLIIEYITAWSMIVIVSIISILLPMLWGFITRKWERVYAQWRIYVNQTVPMMNNEIMLFTSAGLLGHAVQGTAFANQISDFLTRVAQHSFILFALAVLAIVLIITYIGVHQIAVVAALAMQLNPQELGISTLALAMLLLLSWSISSALSPFSGLNLMVSRIVGISGVEVGLRSNGIHLFVIAVIGIGIIMVIG
jgi:hypothetical protein